MAKNTILTVLVNGEEKQEERATYVSRKTQELIARGYDAMDGATVEYELGRVLKGGGDGPIAESIKKDLVLAVK